MKLQFIVILFILSGLISCSDKKTVWLKGYAQTKCEYQSVQEKIKADLSAQISPLLTEREQFQSQLIEFCEPYQKQITTLQEQLKEVDNEYMKEYRSISAEQNSKYGHVSTPEYDKTIASLDQKKQKETVIIENKIAKVKSEMERQNDYKSISEKIKLQEERIKSVQQGINVKYKHSIDSLQKVLNLENSNFKRMVSGLNPDEQKILESERDSIRANPCK